MQNGRTLVICTQQSHRSLRPGARRRGVARACTAQARKPEARTGAAATQGCTGPRRGLGVTVVRVSLVRNWRRESLWPRVQAAPCRAVAARALAVLSRGPSGAAPGTAEPWLRLVSSRGRAFGGSLVWPKEQALLPSPATSATPLDAPRPAKGRRIRASPASRGRAPPLRERGSPALSSVGAETRRTPDLRRLEAGRVIL